MKDEEQILQLMISMGVDHGGTGGQVPPPPEFGAGDANANCLPQILSYRYKNEHSVAFKIPQNPFLVGALPWTPLGELTSLPKPLSRLERGHPSPYPTPLGMNPPSALAMRPPPRSPARSMPMMIRRVCFTKSMMH